MVQQRLNEPDNPSFQPGLPSQRASVPAASCQRIQIQAGQARQVDEWLATGQEVQMQEQMHMQEQQGLTHSFLAG